MATPQEGIGELPVGVRAAMAMANGSRPTLQAEVVRFEKGETEKGEDASKVYFVLKVSTTHDSYNSYTVRRRYAQFDSLHTTLKSGYSKLPALPEKGAVSTKDKRFLEKRKGGLSTYLRAIMCDPMLAKCEDVRPPRPVPMPRPRTPHHAPRLRPAPRSAPRSPRRCARSSSSRRRIS